MSRKKIDYFKKQANISLFLFFILKTIFKRYDPYKPQKTFYCQFKLDLGDPDRFGSLGELIYNIYRTIYRYNNLRIHSKLKMPPVIYSRLYQESCKNSV